MLKDGATLGDLVAHTDSLTSLYDECRAMNEGKAQAFIAMEKPE